MKKILFVVGQMIMCIFGCVSCTKKSHRESEARCDVIALKNAVLGYRHAYDRNPCHESTNNLINHRVIIATLMAQPSWLPEVSALNPAGVRFLNLPPSDRIKGGLWLDPWRNPYHIEVCAMGINSVEIGGVLIHQPVGVWSNGENGRDEFGAGDDVASWK
jgi:hypothetical protein